MKKRSYIFFTALILIFISIFTFSVFGESLSINTIINLFRDDTKTYIENFEDETKDYLKEAGTTETLTVYEDISAYTIHYPIFENAQMNKDINMIIEDSIRKFKEKISSYSKYTPSRATLYINYESFKFSNDVVSVLFDTKYTPPFGKKAETEFLSYSYNTKSNEKIIIENIFKDTSFIKEKIRLFIENNYSKNILSYEDFSSIPQDKLLNIFVFKENEINFYVNKKDILIDSEGYMIVSIPYEDIEDFLDITSPTARLFLRRRVLDPDAPTLALTFDDGPSRKHTNRILDVLDEYDSKATFFVLGAKAVREPDTILRMSQSGHQIGNHSYSHKALTSLTISELKKEISKTNEIVLDVTGEKPKLVRPPYGSVNQTVLNNSETPLILWSIDTLDWKTQNKNKIVKEVLTKAKDGDIILMHDIYRTTADACEVIIPALIEKGFQLVTVEEMFELKNNPLEAKNKYFKALKHE